MSSCMLSYGFEEDIAFQLHLLLNHELYCMFHVCQPHFIEAESYKQRVQNSALIVRALLEKQFANQ